MTSLPQSGRQLRCYLGPGVVDVSIPQRHERTSTKWYHDHTLRMTRLNVYAGPAGFYLIRGGPDGETKPLDTSYQARWPFFPARRRRRMTIPRNKTYYEIPLAIQDRSFNWNGTLFYPDSRAFFDGESRWSIHPEDLRSRRFGTPSSLEHLMVNGNTWPFLTWSSAATGLRFFNGCNSRFLILDFGHSRGSRSGRLATRAASWHDE